MKFALVGMEPDLQPLATRLAALACERGHEPSPVAEARLVFNGTRESAPVAHWSRASLQQFGVSIIPIAGLASLARRGATSDILPRAYPALLRTLSNAVIGIDGADAVLVTPEMGVRPLGAAHADLASAVLDAILPLAATTFAIENEITEDLPESLLASPALAALRAGGRRLAALGLLPSVVRMEDILSAEDLRLLRAVFGLQQISYGNLSVREPTGGFWMTGRGVDKSRIAIVGRDAMLVTDHDEARGVLACRVPRGFSESRVSVDAIEHALLYEAFPSIGAIVHAHAWIDGIASTRQNWPCGTVELARDVRALVGQQPDPGAAEVGLRNHGLTLTGRTLDAIFERTSSRLRREVPAA